MKMVIVHESRINWLPLLQSNELGFALQMMDVARNLQFCGSWCATHAEEVQIRDTIDSN